MGEVVSSTSQKLVRDIIAFPVWWYRFGVAHVAGMLWRSFTYRVHSLAIGVWIKNLFVPMYGQYDIASRLISFAMRVLQIIARGFFLVMWALCLVGAFVMYIIALPFLLFYLLLHLGVFGI